MTSNAYGCTIAHPYCLYNKLASFVLAIKKQKKVTVAQQEVLCEFFEENPEVIRGYKKKPNCIEAVQSKWMEVTPRLNELGPPRTYKDWAKVGIQSK